MVWLDRLLWVLVKGVCDLCKLCIQHATTVLTLSAAMQWYFLVTLGLLSLRNHLWDHKQEIKFEWPYFMANVGYMAIVMGISKLQAFLSYGHSPSPSLVPRLLFA